MTNRKQKTICGSLAPSPFAGWACGLEGGHEGRHEARAGAGRPHTWAAEDERRECPDGGACHHACESKCFRVEFCGPLSGVYPGNEWPAEVRSA